MWSTTKFCEVVVQIDAGRAVAAGVNVVDDVVADFGSVAVGSPGVDAAEIGHLEADGVDQVVRDERTVGISADDAGSAGIVDCVVLNGFVAAERGDAGFVAGFVIDVVDDGVFDGVARPADETRRRRN